MSEPQISTCEVNLSNRKERPRFCRNKASTWIRHKQGRIPFHVCTLHARRMGKTWGMITVAEPTSEEQADIDDWKRSQSV